MSNHCCNDMTRDLQHVCEDHPGRSDCPDALIEYRQETREYGLIVHDGGSSMVQINFCPWCGINLAEFERRASC
jgi:Domain of unknown function (DUF6980)